MAIFTKTEDFKDQAHYVPLLKKALGGVSTGSKKNFLYFKQYQIGGKSLQMVLVDYDPKLKAVFEKGTLKPTAEGFVTLTDTDELDFQVATGSASRVVIKRYLGVLDKSIKTVFIPGGEEGAEGKSAEEAKADANGADAAPPDLSAPAQTAQPASPQPAQAQSSTPPPTQPSVGAKPASPRGAGPQLATQRGQAQPNGGAQPAQPAQPKPASGASPMDRKMAFEESKFKVRQRIDDLAKKPCPPTLAAKRTQDLAAARLQLEKGEIVGATQILDQFDAQLARGAAPEMGPAMAKKMEFEAKQFEMRALGKQLQELRPAYESKVASAENKDDLKKHWRDALAAMGGGNPDVAKSALMSLQEALAASGPAQPQSPRPQGASQPGSGAQPSAAKPSGAQASGPQPGAQPSAAQQAKAELQRQFAALDEGYRQALKVVGLPTDDIRAAHDRVEAALKQDDLNAARLALRDQRFEMRRLVSAGAKAARVAAASKSFKTGVSSTRAAFTPAAGTTAAIEKQKLDPGTEFKAFIVAMKAVEAAPTEPNLKSLIVACQGYIDHFAAKHAGDAKRSKDKNNLEKLRLATEWRGKAQALIGLNQADATQGGKTNDEAALEKAQAQFGVALIDGGLGARNESGGQSDSYKIKDGAGKNAFIFKPQKGEAPLDGMPPGAGMAREAVQSRIGDEMRSQLGMDVPVSRTTIVSVKSPMFKDKHSNNSDEEQIGALQEFLDSDGDAKSKIQKGDRAWMDNVDRRSLEAMAVLDMIMLNGDRKGDNLLIKGQPDGSTKLMPIDAGAGLPSKETFEEKSIQGFFSMGFGTEDDQHCNVYNVMPAAREKFSQESLDAISRLDPAKMRGALAGHKQQIENDFPTTKGTIDDSTLDLSQLSMRMLKRAAADCPIVEINYLIATQLSKLAKLPAVSDADIDAAIADGRRAYVFVDQTQTKLKAATQAQVAMRGKIDAFTKLHGEGSPQVAQAAAVRKQANDLYVTGTQRSIKYEDIVNDDIVKNYLDPAIAKFAELKALVGA